MEAIIVSGYKYNQIKTCFKVRSVIGANESVATKCCRFFSRSDGFSSCLFSNVQCTINSILWITINNQINIFRYFIEIKVKYQVEENICFTLGFVGVHGAKRLYYCLLLYSNLLLPVLLFLFLEILWSDNIFWLWYSVFARWYISMMYPSQTPEYRLQ